MKCRYRIISRLIFIKVLWELFYFNIPIKVSSRLHLFIVYYSSLSFFFAILFFHLFSPLPLYSIHELDSLFPISHLETWTVFCQTSTIKPIFLVILMACFCHLASILTNINDILKGRYSITLLPSSHCWLT